MEYPGSGAGHPGDSLSYGTRFAEDLRLDSLDAVAFLIAVEDELQVIVPDEDARSLLTIGDAVR